MTPLVFKSILPQKKMLPAYLSALSFVIGLFIIGISASISPKANQLSFVSLLFATGLASGMVGILLGFLFGIPKLNKNYSPTENYKTTQKYDPNTNLEEISDWLTKIIVGVSLTQLTQIPRFLTRVADFVLSYNACQFGCTFAKPLVIALIIYFLVSGFLIGYFYTRIWLPKLLALSDHNHELETQNNIWKQSYKQMEKPEPIISSIISKLYEKEESSTASIPTKVKALTHSELKLVMAILSQNNQYTVTSFLTLDETSALNVLVEKGIVDYLQGDKFGYGAILTVIDEEVREALTLMKKK